MGRSLNGRRLGGRLKGRVIVEVRERVRVVREKGERFKREG